MADNKADDKTPVEEVAKDNASESSDDDSHDSDESESEDESEYSDSDDSDSDEDEEEDQGPSMYSKLVTRIKPTLVWLHSKTGLVGWIVASTFLVVGMPLIFENWVLQKYTIKSHNSYIDKHQQL